MWKLDILSPSRTCMSKPWDVLWHEQAAHYIGDLGFPNAYTLSKHMAEDLVTDLHMVKFPVSIVRPSIIGCLAYSPVPGYFGNAAGLTNMILAFASGVAQTFSVPHQPHLAGLM
jgi:fatty acyl-CoA reductase